MMVSNVTAGSVLADPFVSKQCRLFHIVAVMCRRSTRRLRCSARRWAVTEARAGGGLRSTLQLRAAERSDGGEYRCHAHNRYGRSERLMYLHVAGELSAEPHKNTIDRVR